MNDEREIPNQEKRDGRLPIVLFWVCLLFVSNLYFTIHNINGDKTYIIGILYVNNEKQLYLTYDDRIIPQPVLLPVNSYPLFFMPIPINSAEKELLMTVKGIGEVLAEAIITHRKHVGPISSLGDFLKIPGVGEKRATSLITELTFDAVQ